MLRKKEPPWVVVAGGVHRQGGMDKANFALVQYLVERNITVHVVTHRIAGDLRKNPNLRLSLVPVPCGVGIVGGPLLAFRGRQVAHRITQRDPSARVVVNGGNCFWGDINWVHRVHHAWSPKTVDAPPIHRLKHRFIVAAAKREELRNLRSARLIVANSELTKRHVTEVIGGDASKAIEVIYLGTESEWPPPEATERLTARSQLGQVPHRPLVTFMGAIGHDNNKGLDTLLRAWSRLCSNPQWDADLVIAGDGRALPRWRKTVAQSEFHDRVRFLGFTNGVQQLLAASDLLVSPVRYESYGLNVQEALCRGVPAIVSAGAGVAERYPSDLRPLLLPDPEDFNDLEHRISMWHTNRDEWRRRVNEFSKQLRAYSWRDMAERFYKLAICREVGPSDAVAASAELAIGE